jgi:hypothetical protein
MAQSNGKKVMVTAKRKAFLRNKKLISAQSANKYSRQIIY